jgi:SagB-type dehydrogenase family enzyme
MTFTLLVLIPVVLAIVYALYRTRINRPVTKRSLDTFLGLLLLAYFLITSGLGIFWVARQELPVFDIHYLFGYATVLLVLVHVVLNWPMVVALLRQLAPRAMRTDNGRQWRPSVKGVGWLTLLLIFAGAGYWLGWAQGSPDYEIREARAPVAAPSEALNNSITDRAEDEAMSEPSTRGAPLPPPQSIPLQIVSSGDQERTLADHYHEQSKHSRTSIMGAGGIDWSARPSVFKEYPDAELIELPEPHEAAGMSVAQAVEACRKPVEAFADDDEISQQELSTLLFMTNAVTSTLNSPRGTYYLRAAPSAGALYPTVTYVLVRRAAGLAPGLYHYAVREHALHRLDDGAELIDTFGRFADRHHLIDSAPITFIFTSIFHRSGWKYRDRSYRYCCEDAGHLAVQTSLAASALGLDGALIGRFDDGRINGLLGLDEDEEGCMLMMPIGREAPDGGAAPAARAGFVSAPRDLPEDGNALVSLIHNRTCLALSSSEGVAPFPPRKPMEKTYSDLPQVQLPEVDADGDDLFSVIRRRRSHRNWSGDPMSLADLAAMLRYASGMTAGDEPAFDASVQDNHALNLYVLINDVEAVEPGVYAYHRSSHALIQIRSGDFRSDGYTSSLSQDAVGDAQAVLIMTADRETSSWPDGDRGYRYALLDAGMLGGRIYLQAGALGLGCCGIGAYFDDEVSELIDADPEQELVVYLMAIGVKASP